MSNKWYQRWAFYWKETGIKSNNPGFHLTPQQPSKTLLVYTLSSPAHPAHKWVISQTPWQGRAAPSDLQRWKHLHHQLSKQAAPSYWSTFSRMLRFGTASPGLTWRCVLSYRWASCNAHGCVEQLGAHAGSGGLFAACFGSSCTWKVAGCFECMYLHAAAFARQWVSLPLALQEQDTFALSAFLRWCKAANSSSLTCQGRHCCLARGWTSLRWAASWATSLLFPPRRCRNQSLLAALPALQSPSSECSSAFHSSAVPQSLWGHLWAITFWAMLFLRCSFWRDFMIKPQAIQRISDFKSFENQSPGKHELEQ